jgi:hypothetical protein
MLKRKSKGYLYRLRKEPEEFYTKKYVNGVLHYIFEPYTLRLLKRV